MRAHEVAVWWDYGLEAGESYRGQITEEPVKARIVSPLWCAESVQSKWVAMEAELGKDKLVPARLQNVVPPEAFEAIQAADLIGWDGAQDHARALAFVHKICERLGKPAQAPIDMMEELADLRRLTPLPSVGATATAGATPRTSVHSLSERGAGRGRGKPAFPSWLAPACRLRSLGPMPAQMIWSSASMRASPTMAGKSRGAIWSGALCSSAWGQRARVRLVPEDVGRFSRPARADLNASQDE